MATKATSNTKDDSLIFNKNRGDDDQFKDLNLNQSNRSREIEQQQVSHYGTSATAHSRGSLINDAHSTGDAKGYNFEAKNRSKSTTPETWNKKSEEQNDKPSNLQNSKSTLRIHIKAYRRQNNEDTESDEETPNVQPCNKWKKKIESFFPHSPIVQTSFEFPRQQNEIQSSDPEVMQFKASQRLLNPNQSAATNRASSPSPPPTMASNPDEEMAPHPSPPPPNSEMATAGPPPSSPSLSSMPEVPPPANDANILQCVHRPQIYRSEVGATQKGKICLYCKATGESQHGNENLYYPFLLGHNRSNGFYCRICKGIAKMKRCRLVVPRWTVRRDYTFVSDPSVGHLPGCRPISEAQKCIEQAKNSGHAIVGAGVENHGDGVVAFQQYQHNQNELFDESNFDGDFHDQHMAQDEETDGADYDGGIVGSIDEIAHDATVEAPVSDVLMGEQNISSPSRIENILMEELEPSYEIDNVGGTESEGEIDNVGGTESEGEIDNFDNMDEYDDIQERATSPATFQPQKDAMEQDDDDDERLLAPTPTPSRSMSPSFPIIYPPVDDDDWEHPNNPVY